MCEEKCTPDQSISEYPFKVPCCIFIEDYPHVKMGEVYKMSMYSQDYKGDVACHKGRLIDGNFEFDIYVRAVSKLQNDTFFIEIDLRNQVL